MGHLGMFGIRIYVYLHYDTIQFRITYPERMAILTKPLRFFRVKT